MIPVKFQEGNKVWLEGCNLKLHYPSRKFAPRRFRPFVVKAKTSPVNYRLTLPDEWKMHNVFHVDLLTKYVKTEAHGPNYERPPPDMIEGEEEWEVEGILKAERKGQN